MTDALGRVTLMTYDSWSNVTTTTPLAGLQIEIARTYSKDAIPSVSKRTYLGLSSEYACLRARYVNRGSLEYFAPKSSTRFAQFNII